MNAIIAQRWKILAEVNVKVNAKVNAKGVAIVSRVGQHLVLGKGMFVGRACVEAVVIIRDEKYAAVRLRLVDQEAVTNRVESTLADVDFRPRNRHCGQGNCFRSRRRTQMNCAG